MEYKTFQILVSFSGATKYFDVVAVNYESALADLSAAFGDFVVIQYKSLS